MKSKLLKSLAYVFVICLILLIVIFMSNSTLEFVNYIKIACFSIMGLILLFFIYLLVFCAIDNKKVYSLVDSDNYDELIIYIEKRIKSKLYIVPDRISFYNYYLLLAYLHLNDKDMIEKYFELNKSDDFPIISYWKAAYILSNNDNDNIEELYNTYKASPIIQKSYFKYENITNMFECMVLYYQKNYQEANEKLKKVDESRITIPSTNKVINMIKESVE